jgi:prepilin peptidase CpaA
MFADIAKLVLFPGVMAFAACSDLLTMTISNRVSIVLLAGFLLLAMMSGMELRELASHLGAGCSVLIVAFALFTRGWVGGGDAKLAVATAIWLGFDHLLVYLVYASLFGGALTLLLLQFRLLPLPPALVHQQWIERLHRHNGDVPYGIALAAAAVAVYPQTRWMVSIGLPS